VRNGQEQRGSLIPGFDEFSDKELESALRAARQRPSAALVASLKQEIGPRRRPQFGLFPKAAIAGLVTAGLVFSLGVAGALGYASKSTASMGHSLFHTIQAPFGWSGNHTGDRDRQRYGNGNGGDGDKYGRYPFHHQYGHNVPMCRYGRIVYVPAGESFYRLLHGYGPAPCHRHR
jgi:hypothetical protein